MISGDWSQEAGVRGRVAAAKLFNSPSPESCSLSPGLRGTLLRDVDMRRHTTWRAGGRAERVYRPADLNDLAAFLRVLPANEPLLAVGLGSNLLVRDGGLRGTVLLMHAALGELRVEPGGAVSPQGGGRGCLEEVLAPYGGKAAEAATTTLYAQAGVPGAKLARFAALHDLAGAEFFAGIPGTVGGMLAMNAGCYGSEIWEKVARVQVMTRGGELLERAPEEYEIGYRHVVLREKGEGRREEGGAAPESFTLLPSPFSLPKEFFVAAWLSFEKGDGAMAREKIRALLEKRISSQPLNLPNAGSVFRNPPNDYAARLIEQCGLKGRQIGGARVSEKHANFIVNMGGATAMDIENLIGEVQAAVEAKTGIRLHPEVRIVGEAK